MIYASNGRGYSSVRNGFRKFYQRKLEELRSKLAALDTKKKAIAARGLEGLPDCDEGSDSAQPGWSSDNGGDHALLTPPGKEPTPAPNGGAINEIRPFGPRFSVGEQTNCIPASLVIGNDETENESNWRIEAAGIERVLGSSRDAGLDYAIKLSQSGDWRDRRLAAQILADIPTAEARSYLITLSGDHQGPVAKAAYRALKSSPLHPDEELAGKAVFFKDLDAAAGQQ